jgi:putative transcriptional regulator
MIFGSPPFASQPEAITFSSNQRGERHDEHMTVGRPPAPTSGMLLVATPTLLDPNFKGSVVMLLESDEGGALGVILNRPSTLPVSGVLSQWAGVVSDPDVLFHGGPVGPDGALGVGRLSPAEAESAPLGYRPVDGGFGIVDLDTPVDLLAEALADLRIFVGYAGWDAEQLLGEIAEGSWYLVPGNASDVFGANVRALHHAVLRRQPGELAWRLTRPLDPEQN